MKESKVTIIWGILDLLTLAWYLIWRVAYGQMPFFYDISKSVENTTAFGIPALVIIPIISIIVYVSFAFSGFFLIRRKKIGAIISYIQTPFRLLTFVPPSVIFITWPLKFIFPNPKAISAIVTFILLILFSEITKVYTVRNCYKYMGFA